MRTTTRGLALLLLTALAGLTLGVMPASAHSRLLSISPKDGASLPSSPTEVVLTFNESINPQFVAVRVTDSEGGDVVGDKPTAQGAKVTLAIGSPIAAGTYNVVYRVVSADSHPISGSTSFTIAGDPQAPPSASTTPSETTTPDSSATPSTSTSAGASASSTPAPTASTSDNASAPAEAESGGTPMWVWVLVFLGLVGAIGATLYAVKRDESHS